MLTAVDPKHCLSLLCLPSRKLPFIFSLTVPASIFPTRVFLSISYETLVMEMPDKSIHNARVDAWLLQIMYKKEGSLMKQNTVQ
jgi:hypothetical protein